MSSLPVIKYTEETENPLVGDGIEGTQSPTLSWLTALWENRPPNQTTGM